jgi:hypothetical protein
MLSLGTHNAYRRIIICFNLCFLVYKWYFSSVVNGQTSSIYLPDELPGRRLSSKRRLGVSLLQEMGFLQKFLIQLSSSSCLS